MIVIVVERQLSHVLTIHHDDNKLICGVIVIVVERQLSHVLTIHHDDNKLDFDEMRILITLY